MGTHSPITHYWNATFVKLHKGRRGGEAWIPGAACVALPPLLLSLSNLFIFLWVLLWLTRSALAQTWSTVDELFMLSSAHWSTGKKNWSEETLLPPKKVEQMAIQPRTRWVLSIYFNPKYEERKVQEVMIRGLGFSLQRQQKAASSDPLKCHGLNWLRRSTNDNIKIKFRLWTDNIPVVLIMLHGGVCVFHICVKWVGHAKKRTLRKWSTLVIRTRFIMWRIFYHPGIAPPQCSSSDLELKTASIDPNFHAVKIPGSIHLNFYVNIRRRSACSALTSPVSIKVPTKKL